MKSLQFTTIIGCLLLVGCQSAGSLPAKLSSNLFGSSKTDHTLSKDSQSPSAIQLSNDDFRQGEEFLKKGNMKQAEKSFIAVVKQQPENAAAHHRLGYIADKTGNFTMAEIHYITAIKLKPDDPDIACDLGYSYLLQGELVKSQTYLEKALVSNPEHKASLLNMASLRGKQGDYDGALALFRHAGDEQQALGNIARLFPQGRPAGSMVASTVADTKKNLAQTNLEMQREMAALSARKRPINHREASPQNFDLNSLSISPDAQINDAFAQIDRDYDRVKKSRRLPTPDNRAVVNDNLIAQSPQQRIPQNGLPVYPASNLPPTIPGDLPAGKLSNNLDDYAILTPEQQSPSGEMNQAGNAPAGNIFQTNGAMPASPPVPPQAGAVQPSTQIQWASPGLQQQTATMQNDMVNQSLTNRMNPAPVGQIPLTQGTTNPLNPNAIAPQTQLPASQTNRPSYQEAMELALQMGMNAGPGQMFPLTQNGQANSTEIMPSMRAYPSGNISSNPNGQASPLPASSYQNGQPGNNPAMQPLAVPSENRGDINDSSVRNKHEHPFQHLPIQPAGSVPLGSSTNQSPQNNPLQAAGGIQNWPYVPNTNSQYQQVSGTERPGSSGQIQQAVSETPWLNQPSGVREVNPQVIPNPSSGQRSPAQYDQNQQRTSGTPGSSYMPRQWSHSPQADHVTSPTTRPDFSYQQPQQWPQVVPGTR